jgi:hypothetical protein
MVVVAGEAAEAALVRLDFVANFVEVLAVVKIVAAVARFALVAQGLEGPEVAVRKDWQN